MAETSTRTGPRIDPVVSWTIVTDSPLKGITLAREALKVLAWDDAGRLYLLDTDGQFLAVTKSDGAIVSAAISDDGSCIAVLAEGSRLLLLGPDLETVEDRQAVTDATAIAIDAHGRYIAVASKLNIVQFYNKFAKQAGRFETRQHLSHLAFVPTARVVVGVGAYGSISCYDLEETAPGKLGGELAWTEQIMSGVGRLATTGDGGMILIGCFVHGVQRFDLRGQNEGAYHLGGSASMAVPDFAGRTIAVATQEGDLAILGGTGSVRWQTSLPRPAIALEVDALGRFLLYGLGSGEITRLDLQGGGQPSTRSHKPAPSIAVRPGGGPVRAADWAVEIVPTDEQAEFVVLAVVDDPPRVAVITSQNKLELYSMAGKRVGQAPDIMGVGRILRTCPGWIAAATDRQIVVCDLKNSTARRVDVSLAELTHMSIRPDTYGLAIVQEGDRIGRLSLSGRWVWKTELSTRVEDLAIGPDGSTAVTTEDGRLRIYDAAGAEVGGYKAATVEPILLAEAPAGSPRGTVWVTLSRRAQAIRGHALDGRLTWETPTPWEAWALHSIDPMIVVAAADGRAIAYDGSGISVAQGGHSDGPLDLFRIGAEGRALRVSKAGVNLICAEFDGKVTWRAVVDGSIGPIATGRAGVAAMIGRSLTWFGDRTI